MPPYYVADDRDPADFNLLYSYIWHHVPVGVVRYLMSAYDVSRLPPYGVGCRALASRMEKDFAGKPMGDVIAIIRFAIASHR